MFRICFILSIVYFLNVASVFATHLVGGGITYEFVERNGKNIKYRFTMKIYRDLLDSEVKHFDSTVFVAIYQKNNNEYRLYGNNGNGEVFKIQIGKVSRVFPPQYPCLVPPSNIGVEEATYTWEAILKDTSESYIITHQRCCRNATISNIYDPDKRGMTYSVEITPEAQHSNNNSPQFKTFPPILICVGENLNFDHSAIDKEGDILVYSFCNPLIGGFDGWPIPNPPLAPPYESVDFKMPEYSGTTPLGKNIQINPTTGIISGIPDVMGQFVVSVCVEEYRNGQLIGKIYRDFQFNTVSCKRTVVADMVADSVINKKFFMHSCSLDASFINKSYDSSEIKSFIWEFNINGVKNKYTEWHPKVQFTGSGIYTGKLFLNPSTICKDSADIEIHVSQGIQARFKASYDTCIAGPVKLSADIVQGGFPIKSWYWDYDGTEFRDTNKLKTEYQYPTPGKKKITLSVVDSYNCQKDTSMYLVWQPAPPILIVKPDKFSGCTPAQVFFNNKSTPLDSTYKVLWDFGDNSQSSIISPTHTYKQAGLYSVSLKITSPLGCYKESRFSNWIDIKETTPVDFDWDKAEVSNLKPEVKFIDNSPYSVYWQWNFGDGKWSNQQNPTHRFQDTGWYKIQLQVRNAHGCVNSASQFLYVEPHSTFYLPNAFTPNYDAVNDEFKGIGILYGVREFRLSIWNRWGEEVFQTNNPNTGWNGQKNNTGSPCTEGVYLCQVEYRTAKGDKIVKKGYVTLLR